MDETGDRARVIALASGKGGVGKTSIAVNLSLTLAREGYRTMLLDADFGLANAAIMLGLNPAETIEDFLDGRCPIEAVVQTTEHGLQLVPGATGVVPDAAFLDADRRRLAEGFRRNAAALDYVVIDPPSGVQAQTLGFLAMSDRVLLVLTAEPTSFMDAYATVKLLALNHGFTRISVIANMVDSEVSGRDLFDRFRDVAARFLPSELDYLGSLPRDEHMRSAILRKQPCVSAYPASRAAAGVGRLAQALTAHLIPPSAGGARFLGLEQINAAS